MRVPTTGGSATLRYLAAGLAFASELIHLWVLPGQLLAAVLPGLFFLLVAMGQGLLMVSLLFGPGRWTLRFGILLNLTIVFVWTLTHVVSVPELFEPIRMPIGGVDLVATAAEITLVILLVRLRRDLPRKSASGACDERRQRGPDARHTRAVTQMEERKGLLSGSQMPTSEIIHR